MKNDDHRVLCPQCAYDTRITQTIGGLRYRECKNCGHRGKTIEFWESEIRHAPASRNKGKRYERSGKSGRIF